MKLYTYKAVADFIESGLVVYYKVTKVEKVGFNDKEGNIYHVNIRLETVAGYKNYLVTFEINDTYMDCLDDDDDDYYFFDDAETREQYIESLLFSSYILG